MEIKYLSIKNFKSIRHMEISDIQNALILDGRIIQENHPSFMPCVQSKDLMKSHWMILTRQCKI